MKTGISPKHLLEFVIKPVLIHVGADSISAQRLILGTAAQESRLGHYLKQIKGPALGIYQIEPDTHTDIYLNFLNFKKNRAKRTKVVKLLRNPMVRHRTSELITNLEYSTAIARMQYCRFAEPLPHHEDVVSMAKYWKKYFNTKKGDGTIDEFVRVYKKYIEGNI